VHGGSDLAIAATIGAAATIVNVVRFLD